MQWATTERRAQQAADGGDQCAGDVEQREQDKAERQIDRGRRDHEPLVVLKMAEDGTMLSIAEKYVDQGLVIDSLCLVK